MEMLVEDLLFANNDAIHQVEEPYTLLTEKLAPLRSALLNHSVYKLNDVNGLLTFMESHVFAVWDFMSLREQSHFKALQNRLTSLNVPSSPPADILSPRPVDEIVLVEESDQVAQEVYVSHYDLYLAAMEEIGADTQPILSFITSLNQGELPEQALAPLYIPESTKKFVLFTLETTTKSTHEVAAAILSGGEDIIPAMFRQIIDDLEGSEFTCDFLRLYLDSHTFLDENHHSPMGQKILKKLCSKDSLKWAQAASAASTALKACYELWDGVAQLMAVPEKNASAETLVRYCQLKVQ